MSGTLLHALNALRRCPVGALLRRATGLEAPLVPLAADLSGLRAPWELPPPPGTARSGAPGATWMPQLGVVPWEDDPDVHSDPDRLRRWSRGRLREVLHAAGLAEERRDPAAAAFAVRRVEAFLRRCPPGTCDHWRSGMETALRAMRLLHAAARLRSARDAGVEVPPTDALAEALGLHERALRSLTDWRLHYTGNHHLAVLAARVALGAWLPDNTIRLKRLRRDGRRFLSELRRQVGWDGLHFESSTAYALFAGECAAHAVHALRARGLDAGSSAVGDMAGLALPALLRPDGTIASVGDSDDESFLPATAGPEPPAPLRALELARALGCEGPSLPRTHRGASGLHVLALAGEPSLHATISSLGRGRAGTGGHFHDDAGSIELWLGGPLLGHRGTGAYGADLALREELRSVRSHAAVQVDDREMNAARPGHAFRRSLRSHPFVVEVPGADVAVGHHGFATPPPGAVVLRTFRLTAPEGLAIEDRVTGAGRHRVTLRLPWAPGIIPSAPEPEGSGGWRFDVSRGGIPLARIRVDAGEAALRAAHVPARHWPRQGESEPAITTELSLEAALPVVIRHCVSPAAWGAPGSP